MVDKRTTEKLKGRLEQELARLELELTDIGHLNPSNPADWQGDTGNYDTGTADASLLADRFEETTTNEGIVSELEGRYNNVKDALARIKKGTYGTCDVCGTKIAAPRLEANPAASTCVEHAE